MSSTVVTVNGGKYKVEAIVGRKTTDDMTVYSLIISTITGESSIQLTFDSEAGLMEFGGKTSEAVMKGILEKVTK